MTNTDRMSAGATSHEMPAHSSWPNPLKWRYRILLAATSTFLASTYFSIAINSLSMGMMAATLIGISAIERRWPIRRTPLDIYFLGFLLAQTISTVFAVDPLQSLIFSKRILLVCLVYFFASTVTTEPLSKKFVSVLLGSATIVATIGVAKLLLGGPGENTRLGIFQFYMTTSGLLMIAALLMFPYTIHSGTPKMLRWTAIVAMPPILISLFATVTRGAYLAVIAGMTFIAIVRNKRLLIPICIVILLIIVFAPPYIESRIKSIIDPNHPENISRIELWKTGFRIFKDHPIVGAGDIDYGKLIDQYADPSLPREWGHFHNTPIQLLVNYGVLGFAVLMGLFVKMFSTEWRIFQQVKNDWFKGSFVLGSLAALVGFCVMGLTEWSFGDQEVITLIWTTLGIVLSMTRHAVAEPMMIQS